MLNKLILPFGRGDNFHVFDSKSFSSELKELLKRLQFLGNFHRQWKVSSSHALLLRNPVEFKCVKVGFRYAPACPF